MALRSQERRTAKRQRKERSKKRVLSKSKWNNIKKHKQALGKARTPKDQTEKKKNTRAKRMKTYAELKARKANAAKKKEERLIEEKENEITGEEMMSMMDPEYLEDLKDEDVDIPEDEPLPEEQKLRSFDKLEVPRTVKPLLPVRTKDGRLEVRFAERMDGSVSMKRSLHEEEKEMEDEEVEEDRDEMTRTTAEFLYYRQRRLEKKKVNIGCIASNFLIDPEKRLSGLKSLLTYMEEKDPGVKLTVRKYAALTLLQVFRRIIPSHRIIEPKLGPDKKLKKITKIVCDYEKGILTAYQKYLTGLENMIKEVETNKHPAVTSMAVVATQCLGELLVQNHHFNYTSNIIQALVPLLNHKNDDVVKPASSAITKIFKDDVSGRLSHEIVRRIDQVVRRRAFAVRPPVFEVLLGLKLRGAVNLDVMMEQNIQYKKKFTHQEKLIRKLSMKNVKKKGLKEAKVFRKKRRLEEAMRGLTNSRNQRKMNEDHADIIILVFALYVHVLKRRPNKKLNSTVLEGLAKFSHLVNIEYFADLLTTLGALMNEGTLKLRESLHCIQVVFTILAGQGQVLTLDPTSFYQYLYVSIFNISADTNHDDIVTVAESLRQMMAERGSRTGHARILSFVKRLASSCLTLLHSGSITALSTLRSILLAQHFTEVLLEVDSEGCSGIYDSESPDPQHTNASATALWELHLLKRHYHSTVRQMSHHLMQGAPLHGQNTLPHSLTKRLPSQIYETYDMSEMRFNPSIPSPLHHLSASSAKAVKRRRHHGPDHWTSEYITSTVQDLGLPDIQQRSGQDDIKGQDKDQDILDIDFSAGMLSNMDLDQIPSPSLPDQFPDYTLSLIRVKEAA
ncbi:hypothetical protein Pcinc_005859 [Petrolisthes cinctipes]|uniref:NOC3-like protein n=1 Tax=Petrolisthes cinctipes TaxID=88211 RepID=A0AAE1KYM5_PETCI|nr:hypothetical protein Pcinc_005859 [Petrolisthes cinctipes]